MSDYSYIIVAYSLTALAAIYMVSYYSTLFSNCSSLTGQLSEKECCEGTWGSITSSVQLTLYILAGALIVMYMIFYWGQTGELSWVSIILVSVYFVFIGMYTLLRDVIKVNIFR